MKEHLIGIYTIEADVDNSVLASLQTIDRELADFMPTSTVLSNNLAFKLSIDIAMLSSSAL